MAIERSFPAVSKRSAAEQGCSAANAMVSMSNGVFFNLLFLEYGQYMNIKYISTNPTD
jgi:hypothetical protein